MTIQNKLTVKTVASLTKIGLHTDGGGLVLQITAGKAKIGSADTTLTKSWLYRYRQGDKIRSMGLGSVSSVTLAEAREKAAACRKQRTEGNDPLQAREEAKAAKKVKASEAQVAEAAKLRTFEHCAEQYIRLHEGTWKNPKHRQQWRNTLETYAYPSFGKVPVADVETSHVTAVLLALWNKTPETGSRVRGRIETILNWAAVQGFRSRENPAQWRGHLEHVLPRKAKVRAVKHHSALPYADVPAFVAHLRTLPGLSSLAFELLIYSACRTSEVLHAQWSEFDLTNKVWTIPAERMKSPRPHRVPLTEAALKALGAASDFRRENDDWVFPGEVKNRPLSGMALLMLIRRMKVKGVTAHGFRSSFRDWASETTAFPNQVAEMALAHAVGDKVEAAYRRGDLFEKRREMMDAWATFIEKHKTNPLKA